MYILTKAWCAFPCYQWHSTYSLTYSVTKLVCYQLHSCQFPMHLLVTTDSGCSKMYLCIWYYVLPSILVNTHQQAYDTMFNYKPAMNSDPLYMYWIYLLNFLKLIQKKKSISSTISSQVRLENMMIHCFLFL